MLQYNLPRQQEGWLYGQLALNVNNGLIFRVKNGGLNHNNGRSACSTSVITPSAMYDVMMVKLLASAPTYWAVRWALLETSNAQAVTHNRETETHTHAFGSLVDIHMLAKENEIQHSLVWYNEKNLKWYQGARLALLENKIEKWGKFTWCLL